MAKKKYIAQSEEKRCVACGVCVKTCPREAIAIVHGCYAHIDTNKCIGCGLCVKACPAGIIERVACENQESM